MKKWRNPLCLLLVVLTVIGTCVMLNTALAVEKTVTVTFAFEDGRVIRSYQVPYGEMPEYDGPEKARDEYFDYKLTGWTPEIAPAVEEAVYYPLYDRCLRTDEGAKSRLRGDANGNGRIDIMDATTIQRYLVHLNNDPLGIITVLGITGSDSNITILDATRIQRFLAGFENTYHIGMDVLIPIEEPTDAPTDEPTDEPTAEPTDPPTEPTQLPTAEPDPYELPPA